MEHEQPVPRPAPTTATTTPRGAVAGARKAPTHTPGGIIVQAKLCVGPADDPFEREADDVAARVVRSLHGEPSSPRDPDEVQPIGPTQRIQRIQRVQRVQRRTSAAADPPFGILDHETEQQIRASRSAGRVMRSRDRASMESAFDADFSGVRVHVGPRSAELNTKIQARAFTVGKDIYFRDGHPDTSSTDGRHLLAHELTHTIQQTGHVNRIVRRTHSPAIADRVQRTGITVSGRVTRPVVQRVGEAKAAHDALTLLVAQAKQIRDKALEPGTSVDQLAQVKLDIDRIGSDADKQVLAAQKDKTMAAGYAGSMKTLRVQVQACQDKIHGPEVAATSSLTSINATLAEFQGAIALRTGEGQPKVTAALAQLRVTLGATTAKAAKIAAEAARQQCTELTAMQATFNDESVKALAKVRVWVIAAQGSHLAIDAAVRSEKKLSECTTLTKSILVLLSGDAEAAATRAETFSGVFQQTAAAIVAKKSKDTASKEKLKKAQEANALFDTADAHSRRCADEAAEAKKLSEEAIEAALEAERLATQSDSTASSAEAKAKSMSASLSFYNRHAAQAPSADASKFVEQRHSEAQQAEVTARDKRAESEVTAITARDVRSRSEPFKQQADEKGKTEREAFEQRALAAKDREAAQQAKVLAESEYQAADQELTNQTASGRQLKLAGVAHANQADALAVSVPDATLRAQIRLEYGEAVVRVLLAKGVGAQLLLDGAATIKAMVASWTASDAGDVVRKVQDLLGGSVLLADFHKNAGAVVAARALVLLDCPGAQLPWFVAHGMGAAGKLLDFGWPATDVKRVLKAAEQDAKLGGAQLATFEALVEKVTIPVDTAEKLLKAGVTASFLIDNALSSIETLLAVPWDADKIVDLVKAAGDLPKPTKLQLVKFCTLVDAEAVAADDAIKIMKGADCTGAYLVDTAFIALRDAVADAWTADQLKAFVKAAETKAVLDQAQIDRFYLLHDNAFTAVNAARCLNSANVADWTMLMDQVDNFVADGNTGNPPAVGGGLACSHTFGPPGNRVRIEIQGARISHFAAGHTYAHYEFTSANIYRAGGNQPSSMWAVGTTAADVVASAYAAVQTAGVHTQATNARGGIGNGPNGDFDQVDHGAYVAGVQWFPGAAVLMQFFPNGVAVHQDTMAAIGRLFKGVI